MYKVLAIALGGSLGALSRYALVGLVTAWSGRQFPYGTLLVNIIGSFLMGVMYVLVVEKLHANPQLQAIAMVGFLGAFTTFSTYALETVHLFQAGRPLAAITYVVTSVVVCVLAVYLAMQMTQHFLKS